MLLMSVSQDRTMHVMHDTLCAGGIMIAVLICGGHLLCEHVVRYGWASGCINQCQQGQGSLYIKATPG